MPTNQKPLKTFTHIKDARDALEENARLINQDDDRVAWNTNIALLQICEALQTIRIDVELFFIASFSLY